MSILATVGAFLKTGVAGKIVGSVIDKVNPDKAESRRQQHELNMMELDKAPQSRLFLWRPFTMWLFALLAAWEIVVRPIIVTYWPDATVPPSMLETVLEILLGGMALGF